MVKTVFIKGKDPHYFSSIEPLQFTEEIIGGDADQKSLTFEGYYLDNNPTQNDVTGVIFLLKLGYILDFKDGSMSKQFVRELLAKIRNLDINNNNCKGRISPTSEFILNYGLKLRGLLKCN